jgi:hypothetical protein
VGGIFFALGVLMMIPLLWGLPSDLAIVVGKHVVPGQVLRVGKASYSVNRRTPARIHYRYQYAGNEYESYSDAFDPQDIGLTEEPPTDATLNVQVSGLWPGCSRLEGTHNWVVGPLGLVFLLFPLLGGSLLFFSIRSNRREIRAFVHGVPITAKVVSVGEDRSTTINGRHPLQIAWEFRMNDEVYSGSLSTMLHLDLEEFLAAQEIVVLYDPGRPEINTLFIA